MSQSGSNFVPVSPALTSTGQSKEVWMPPVHVVGWGAGEESRLRTQSFYEGETGLPFAPREAISTLQDYKETRPLLWRGNLFLSFRSLHPSNIFKKVTWHKMQSVPSSQDVNKHWRFVENYLLALLSSG